MNKRHLLTFSATGFQIIFNQFFGLAFFILLATHLNKEIFGDLNWSIAVSATLCIALTFGFDHIVVKKLSSGYSISKVAGTYFTHVALLSVLSLLAIILHRRLFGSFHQVHQLLFAIFIGSLFTFMTSPLKQLANGVEKYWHLAVMNITGNAIRVLYFAVLIICKEVTPQNIELLFILSGIVEFIICYYLTFKILKCALAFYINLKSYLNFIREALPQMGVILLDSSYGRIDWILMGLLSTNIFTADYSFSYKAFESSRIPLLIIAPVLLPKLSKAYSSQKSFNSNSVAELNALWKFESIVCMIIPLLLNVCWVDAINLFTNNRYGIETKWVYAILSVSLPMLYITNYLWTIAFAQGRLKLTFKISAIVTLSNFVLNILLIGRYKAVGAAMAFLISSTIQLVLYRYYVCEKNLKTNLLDFLKTGLLAAGIIVSFNYIHVEWVLRAAMSLFVYIAVLALFGVINLKMFRAYFNKSKK